MQENMVNKQTENEKEVYENLLKKYQIHSEDALPYAAPTA